jgi:molybdenum-dependent DNA-binding transcriptional regulator ModE
VTRFGRALVRRYAAMEDKASAAIAKDLQQFSRHLKKRTPARGGR